MAGGQIVNANVANIATNASRQTSIARITDSFQIRAAGTSNTLFRIQYTRRRVRRLLRFAARLLYRLTNLSRIIFRRVTAGPTSRIRTMNFAHANGSLYRFRKNFARTRRLRGTKIRTNGIANRTRIRRVQIRTFRLRRGNTSRLHAF